LTKKDNKRNKKNKKEKERMTNARRMTTRRVGGFKDYVKDGEKKDNDD